MHNRSEKYGQTFTESALARICNIYTKICLTFAKCSTFLSRNIWFLVDLRCSFAADFSSPLTALYHLFLLNLTSLALMEPLRFAISSYFNIYLEKEADNQYKIKSIHFSTIDQLALKYKMYRVGLSLSFESTVVLIFTPITNLLHFG